MLPSLCAGGPSGIEHTRQLLDQRAGRRDVVAEEVVDLLAQRRITRAARVQQRGALRLRQAAGLVEDALDLGESFR